MNRHTTTHTPFSYETQPTCHPVLLAEAQQGRAGGALGAIGHLRARQWGARCIRLRGELSPANHTMLGARSDHPVLLPQLLCSIAAQPSCLPPLTLTLGPRTRSALLLCRAASSCTTTARRRGVPSTAERRVGGGASRVSGRQVRLVHTMAARWRGAPFTAQGKGHVPWFIAGAAATNPGCGRANGAAARQQRYQGPCPNATMRRTRHTAMAQA